MHSLVLGSEPMLRGLLSSRLQCSHGQVALVTPIGIGVPRVPGAFHTTDATYALSEGLKPDVRSHSLKVLDSGWRAEAVLREW